MSDSVLQNLLAPLVEGLGYELWGVVRLKRQTGLIVRVYIDSAAGVTISDCERVSRQIGDKLDVEDAIRGEYTLEVSSPGMDRPLFTPAQFERYPGAKVKIRTTRPIGQRRNFAGVLQYANAESVGLDVDGTRLDIPFTQIEKTNLVP